MPHTLRAFTVVSPRRRCLSHGGWGKHPAPWSFTPVKVVGFSLGDACHPACNFPFPHAPQTPSFPWPAGPAPTSATLRPWCVQPSRCPGKGRFSAGAAGAPGGKSLHPNGPKLANPSEQWIAGVAPGPAGARRFHLFVPPGAGGCTRRDFCAAGHAAWVPPDGSDLAAISRMNRIVTRKRFLVLYPEQERMANPRAAGTGTSAAAARPMPRRLRSSPPWTRWRGGTPWTCHVWPWRACRRVPAWLRCSRRCTPRGSAPWPCIWGWHRVRPNRPPTPYRHAAPVMRNCLMHGPRCQPP